jgi:hypothetical protein
MTDSPGAPPVQLDDQQRIAEDLSCAECGYNLRTIAISASCPECGVGVQFTISTTRGTAYYSLRDLQRLRIGLRCIGSAIALMYGVIGIELSLQYYSAPHAIYVLISTIALLLAAGGWFGLKPCHDLPTDSLLRSSLRSLCRSLLIVVPLTYACIAWLWYGGRINTGMLGDILISLIPPTVIFAVAIIESYHHRFSIGRPSMIWSGLAWAGFSLAVVWGICRILPKLLYPHSIATYLSIHELMPGANALLAITGLLMLIITVRASRSVTGTIRTRHS